MSPFFSVSLQTTRMNVNVHVSVMLKSSGDPLKVTLRKLFLTLTHFFYTQKLHERYGQLAKTGLVSLIIKKKVTKTSGYPHP